MDEATTHNRDSAHSARFLVAQYAQSSIGEPLEKANAEDILVVCQDVIANICHYVASVVANEDEAINRIVGKEIGGALADFLIERRQEQRIDAPDQANMDDLAELQEAVSAALLQRGSV